jgi:aconitate hydratase
MEHLLAVDAPLNKQGLLALTFRDPGDYDKIREDDRIGVVGLSGMAPGKPIECLVTHVDGSTETLQLDHSFGKSQLAWLRLGSALNVFQESARQGS